MHSSKRILKDELLFSEGEIGDCAYLIQTGRVLVFVKKAGIEVPLKILGAGEVFGEMALIDGSSRSASCRSLEETTLAVVTKDQLLERIQKSDPVVQLLMNSLLKRLRTQNEKVKGQNESLEESQALSNAHNLAIQRIETENKIATALEEDAFLPYYQPIYNMQTGKIAGCEALIRWQTKSGELISPALFMDIMEESSMALRGGDLMIEKSLTDLPQMMKTFADSPDFFVSINVGGRQFADPAFCTKLEAARKKHGVPAQNIKIEITERVVLDGPQALASISECRRLGYRIAIDDFGTGFSSLQYLTRMDLTDLKIDRSFIVGMENEKGMAMVKALVHIASLLRLDCIAEGIETREQARLIQNMGVKMGQGYLFGKPLPLANFLKTPDSQKAELAAS